MRAGRRQHTPQASMLLLHLNARLQPMHRGEVFEDPLDELLQNAGIRASVEGGGTLASPEGEPLSCDIELAVQDASIELASRILTIAEGLGVPKGSSATIDGEPVGTNFGWAECVALYLNGTDLPAEVYAESDVNALIAEIHRALGDSGTMLSYWEGPRETALYLYGRSASTMQSRLADLVGSQPLLRLCRVVRVA